MSVFASALKSALEPGTGNKFVLALNGVLLALLGVIAMTIWTGMEDSFHMYIFLFLAIGLTVSINWFILEARALQADGKLDLSSLDGAATPANKKPLAKTD
ncbi:hypothetical protein SPRG_02936 [Saprolegnia parasitica CBS 223.65]|uniref:Uncharacterized protein n=1 Tax=Saprolegnia parasitica (strain CBS 223.65) TaxID=695850 RepID=A0A067CP24_SAPPC|nr:hypothetical protein SPRG_02936 [Saprolegnia parasitica CBS 223.65]KDO32459.1 hypothetical protein SPRG_02936 [Saprolegnia parasitica CBS 223.65]|eukprot:XP_012196910.1 hypothetical protein SPRG_02936 [Saprolegnia parasitica CBS 223.65]